jgi:hypothetical protein
MRRFAWLCVAAGILAGCAPTMATLPTTASAADRRQAERCHARALEEANQAPGPLRAHFAKATPGEVAVGALQTLANLPAAAVVLVTAPVWYPIAKTKHHQRLYDDAVARCLEGRAAEGGATTTEGGHE